MAEIAEAIFTDSQLHRGPAPSRFTGVGGPATLERMEAGIMSKANSRTRRAEMGLATTLVALALATPASARQWSAVCSNLTGVRVEDDGQNPAFTQDAIQGASWAYRWDTVTKKATLTLPASHAFDGKPHQQDGVVSPHRGGFYTIVSSLPGAVWTHAIYPETGRLLATQSTTKSGTSLSGRVLVGTCVMSP